MVNTWFNVKNYYIPFYPFKIHKTHQIKRCIILPCGVFVDACKTYNNYNIKVVWGNVMVWL